MAMEPILARSLAAPIPGILDLLGQSGPMAIFVLGLLIALSILSWGVMIERWRRFRSAEREDRALLEKAEEEPSLGLLAEFGRDLPRSPLAGILGSYYDEVRRQTAAGGLTAEGHAPTANPGHIDPRVKATITRKIEKRALELSRAHHRFLGFLATTATVAPFIGLFGTVWGIMNAFRSIGAAGGASIAAYAPGIAEALVTTAAGLAAAIPAVAGYNLFAARARRADESMDDFAADLLNRLDAPPR